MEASVPAKARRGTGNLESVQNHCVPLLFLPRLALPNHDLAAFLYVSRARVKARPDVAKISTTRTKHPTYHAAHLSGQRLHITYSVLPRSRKSHCTFEVSLPTKNNCHHGAATNQTRSQPFGLGNHRLPFQLRKLPARQSLCSDAERGLWC